jgi:hypothetical protein
MDLRLNIVIFILVVLYLVLHHIRKILERIEDILKKK